MTETKQSKPEGVTENSKQVNIIGLIIGVVFAAVISGILIWVVGTLGLGLEVDNIGAAFIAGAAIAVVGGVITWLLSLVNIKAGGGILGAILNILLGAVVLLISDRFIAGLTVNGFTGALVASIAIGAISWLLSMVLGRINQAATSEQDKELMP